MVGQSTPREMLPVIRDMDEEETENLEKHSQMQSSVVDVPTGTIQSGLPRRLTNPAEIANSPDNDENTGNGLVGFPPGPADIS